ncbi:hypothetical protein, partial [Sulfoacidibacillus ferrooxidans]|uniref:hypothetical protein n=1 Tax=Sulfoacidibacillus ferrooxidans TaxID=2005001 RepID=UPI001F509613
FPLSLRSIEDTSQTILYFYYTLYIDIYGHLSAFYLDFFGGLQGGLVSPLIAVIALQGMEKDLR